MRFSANLGFLWNDRPLPDAIRAAHAAGFDAVECHWPYACPAGEVSAALAETGLAMLGLNTLRGDFSRGENGLAALQDRQAEARKAIDQALAYAGETGAGAVHVMAGCAAGEAARQAFSANLAYACDRAGPDLMILIEPLNSHNAPGYFLNSTSLAAAIIQDVGAANLKLMFDFYHVQILEGDVTRRFERLLPLIGHVQVAAVPDRGAPDHGELDYNHVFRHLDALGWTRPVGAEYVCDPQKGPDLGWLGSWRRTGSVRA